MNRRRELARKGTRPAGAHAALTLAACLVLWSAPGGPARALQAEEIDHAIERATESIRQVQVDPFQAGVPAFRTFTIEAEIWHRLWAFETDPSRRRMLEQEVVLRLKRVQDEGKLNNLLDGPGGDKILTEMAILAQRCTQHGLPAGPLGSALSAHRSLLLAEVERVSPSIGALYPAYLPAAGIDLGTPLERFRRAGMLATRPREVNLTLADVYGLTHEIFAYTDYAMRPLEGLSSVERSYLLRVLPFYVLFYLLLDNQDVSAELLACLHAAGMRDTYGYREGLRVLLERQNTDGSFGTPPPVALDEGIHPSGGMHPTMNALTVLLLERASLRATE